VQYPTGLANSFVTVNVGSIGYAFSEQQLAPGHSVGSIEVPHMAANVVLFGHHFNTHVSVQGSYMRPIKVRAVPESRWHGRVADRVDALRDGDRASRGCRSPTRLSVFGEVGLAITSRRGFALGDRPAVTKRTVCIGRSFGGGIEYGPEHDARSGGRNLRSFPHDSQDNNPATIFTSAGIRFNMRPVPPERVAEIVAGRLHLSQDHRAGRLRNRRVRVQRQSLLSRDGPNLLGRRRQGQTKRPEPAVGAQRVPYQEGVRGRLRRELLGMEEPAGKRRFRTLSVFPVLRFNVVRTRHADAYVSFSEAGPTYISRVTIDGRAMGGHFTFQDFMAAGVFIGARKRLNVEFNLNHYSNGNLMADNAGVAVPLALKLGYAF
jgi:hypothetical protein